MLSFPLNCVNIGVFSAPANMLAFRSPSMLSSAANLPPPPPRSHSPTHSQMAAAASAVALSIGLPSSDPANVVAPHIVERERQQYPGYRNKPKTLSNSNNTLSSENSLHPRQPLVGSQAASPTNAASSTLPSLSQQAPAYVSAFSSARTQPSPSKMPTSKRAPTDPVEAPGVTFRSTLKPPASAQIPDIPYGAGQGTPESPRRPRTLPNGSAKARSFTPSDTQMNMRTSDDNGRKAPDYTARNAGSSVGGGNTQTIIASSGKAFPSPNLYVPAAPLTVNAPVVAAHSTLVTPIDPQALEAFKESTASPTKQPPKSALKARSWADLVRPLNDVQIAEETVQNIGLNAEQLERKKKVSIALPSKTPSGQTTPTRVPTHAHIPTAVGNDKSPHHSSPPPEAVLDNAAGRGESGEIPASPKRAPSVLSNATGVSAAGSAMLTNLMSRKRNLEELLSGVENSTSHATLYPRGLVNTGNACFMNSILQTLLFTAPFYNLISLIGIHTPQDLSGKTPLLDAMVSYLTEFRTSNPDHVTQLGRGESYEEEMQKGDAFVPSIIYHALNHNTRFAIMGFYNPTGANGVGPTAPLTQENLAINSNSHLSQEDAQEFLGFFLDTIHEELLVKIETYDKQRWEKANKGYRAGMDSLTRQSVNGAADFAAIQAPHGPSNPASVVNPPHSVAAPSIYDESSATLPDGDDDWLEVGSKGRTAITRTTETQESAVTRIFGGQLRSILRFPGQKDSVTLEPYMSLQLEIQVNYGRQKRKNKRLTYLP